MLFLCHTKQWGDLSKQEKPEALQLVLSAGLSVTASQTFALAISSLLIHFVKTQHNKSINL